MGENLHNIAAKRFSPQHTINLDKLSSNLTSEKLAVFDSQIITIPPFLAEESDPSPKTTVLGEQSSNKRIEVDLTNQRLYAYEGDRLIYNFLISSGKWGKTPTGTFQIWTKLRATKMEGGSKTLRTYYYLPNVPYVMFFYNNEIAKMRGFSLHGTYWHSNFGHPMSHGCVNMKTEEAKLIYDWSMPVTQGNMTNTTENNPGTTIIIYGTAPTS